MNTRASKVVIATNVSAKNYLCHVMLMKKKGVNYARSLSFLPKVHSIDED